MVKTIEVYGGYFRENKAQRRSLHRLRKGNRASKYPNRIFFNRTGMNIESSSPLRSPLKQMKE
jgi:hypothetical protein